MCALIGSALVGGGGLASGAPRQVVFENSGSDGRCLDVTSYAGGTPVTLYGCYGGVSQTWVVERDHQQPRLGAHHVPGRELLRRQLPGAPVPVPRPGRQWTVTTGNKVRNVGGGGGVCLDVQSYVDYAPALIFPCQVTPSQVWPPW
ncbi:RICIN domain-containing protein [Saccharothrix sp. 6-C]|uniref:RICIN domain-containing protein n=1 Tax=Saccharothrix sp. 6-C TaxID=2781735 RepID=UPI0019176A5C|nr:RICIN domain-containing protein [Saccharothrix sp. 6-C]QQQ74097.1 RICIN domain-containing protein [Saccharothrix sp. 6-C]